MLQKLFLRKIEFDLIASLTILLFCIVVEIDVLLVPNFPVTVLNNYLLLIKLFPINLLLIKLFTINNTCLLLIQIFTVDNSYLPLIKIYTVNSYYLPLINLKNIIENCYRVIENINR